MRWYDLAPIVLMTNNIDASILGLSVNHPSKCVEALVCVYLIAECRGALL